jgi:hypothetical protein
MIASSRPKTGRYLDGRSAGGGGRCRRNIAGDLLCPHRPSRPSRGIVNNAIEATSRNHPCNRECAAGVGFRTVFHGLGSCSGQRVELRSRFCQFRLFRTWSAERASRFRRECDVPANWLRVQLSFMRHPRQVGTSQDTPRTIPRIVAYGGGTTPATFLTALPQ